MVMHIVRVSKPRRDLRVLVNREKEIVDAIRGTAGSNGAKSRGMAIARQVFGKASFPAAGIRLERGWKPACLFRHGSSAWAIGMRGLSVSRTLAMASQPPGSGGGFAQPMLELGDEHLDRVLVG
jgi:hypothetical protein